MIRAFTILLAIVALAVVPAAYSQSLDFQGSGFSTVQDVAGSSNILIDANGLHLDTTTNSIDLNAGTVNRLADVYRGEVSFQTLDDNGPYWIEWAKDDHAAVGGSPGFFEGNVDECLLADDLDGVIQQLGTGQGKVYDTDNGTRFRVGPYPAGATPVSTASSGASFLPEGWTTSHRASALSFMTTGAHDDDSDTISNVQYYTVFIDYAGFSDDVNFAIPIARDNQNGTAVFFASSSGDAICNLGTSDAWCVRPQSTSSNNSRVGATGCACDALSGTGSDDQCVMLEVSIAIDPSLQLDDLTIAWTDYDSGVTSSGLNGPFAVTMTIEEATYDDLFDYRGVYQSVTTLDAASTAIWRQISWNQTGSEEQVRASFDCGDSSNGADFTSGNWGEDNVVPYPFHSASNIPSFEIASATATSGDPAAYQHHCVGRYSTFAVELIDTFAPGVADSSPSANDLTLQFHQDADGDAYPATAFPGSNPADCNDNSPAINPGASEQAGNDVDENCSGTLACYIDADNDGFGSAIAAESSYTATGSVADIAGACGSSSSDGFDDDSTDCNDSSGQEHPGQTWYPDCDGDGIFSDTFVTQCGIPSGSMVCNDLQDPDGGWTTQAGLDCDDENAARYPDAFEICDGIDNDCNSLTDDNDPGVVDQIRWCADADHDGFGSAAVTELACDMPTGFVLDCSDCNDSDSNSTTGCGLPFFADGFESPAL